MNRRAMIFTLLLFFLSCATPHPKNSGEKFTENTRYSTYLTYYMMKDYVSQGKFSNAVYLYKNFKGTTTNYIDFLGAYSLMKTGKFKKSAQLFESLASKGFFPDYSLYFAGLGYFKNGDFNKSQEILEKHLKQFPSSIFINEDRCILTKITLKLGIDKYYEGDFPDSADCLFTLIQKRNKDGKPIKNLVKKFILKYPGHPYEDDLLKMAQTTIFRLLTTKELKQRWNLLLSSRKFNLLKKEVKRFSRGTGDKGCYYYYLAMIRFKRKDYKTARRLFIKARQTRINACAQETLYHLARALARLNKNKKSLLIFKTLLKKFPRTDLLEEVLYRIALVYSYMDDTDSTIRGFENYLKKYPAGKYSEEAHWELASSYYEKGITSVALEHLKKLAQSNNYYTRAKAIYWLAKWDKEESDKYIKEIEEYYPLNYYNYISTRCMRHIPSPLSVKVKFYSDNITDFPRPSTTIAFHFYNIRELIHLDLTRYIKSEINTILDNATSKMVQSYIIARLLKDNKFYYLAAQVIIQNLPDSVLLIKNHSTIYMDLLTLIYPRAYENIVLQWAEKFTISPLWIWAVMRQESRFNPRAVSIVNAKGIMQVMDFTARKMLKKMGDNPYYYNPFDVDDNVKVGSFYLKFLFDKFKGDPVLAIAAYNAGEDRVVSWLTKKYTCIDSFVEKIPFPETKKYVKKVISNWMVYNFLSRMPYYEFSKSH